MKKTILTILVCGIMVLGLTGCENSKNELKKYSDDNPINRYILMKRMEKISGYNIENFTEDFNLLNNLGKIGINNFGVYYKKDSIRDYIKQNYDEKVSCILLDRLDGLTLEEIGEKNDITRERVRQIESKSIRKLRKDPKIKKFA